MPGIPKELVSLCWWQKSGPSQDPVGREKREEEGRKEEWKEGEKSGRNNKNINSYVCITDYLASIVKRTLLPTNKILQPYNFSLGRRESCLVFNF